MDREGRVGSLVLDCGDFTLKELEFLGDPQQMIINVTEINQIFRANEGKFVARELVENFPLRPDGAPDMDQ